MSEATTPAQSTIDKIREMFKAGKILTSCGAAEAYETADLRKIISVLRGKGMDIVDRWKKSSTGKKHKEYFLREFTPKDETKSDSVPPPLDPPSPQPIDPIKPTLTGLEQAQRESAKSYQQTLFPLENGKRV